MVGMCLVALFFRAVEDAHLVVGANREEIYARPGEPPQLLDGVRAVGGVDPLTRGTWLGVNEHGVLAAVTNRRKSTLPAQPRSRGLLVRDLLGCRSAAAAVDLGRRELDSGRYAGCNLVIADRERAVVLHGGDILSIWPLPPGLHVLANRDLNDPGDARVICALGWLGQRSYQTSKDCVAALKELCGLRGGEGPPMCLHGELKGTVSSSVFTLRASLANSVYLHAQGPPDTTAYEDYSPLLHQLAAAPTR
jgi:uncharacterized protein with NRDE domain